MISENNSPPVVFVILTCDQRETTLQCLKSLAECEYANKQVILVDNGSSDSTLEAVGEQFPDVHCLRNEKNLGAAAGRNVGIDYALSRCSFEYIMFMDNDIVVMPDFLDKLVLAMERYAGKGVEIASPKLYIMDSGSIIDCAGGAKINFWTGSTQTRGHGEEDVGQYDDEPFPNCVPATVLVHRRALLRARRFDVSFDPYGYEDLDMVLRANLPGVPFLFVADAIVYHRGSRTGFSGYSAEYTKTKARNLKRFLRRHSSPVQRVSFVCLLPFLAVKPVCRELRKGNFSSVAGLIRGFINS